MKLEDLNTLPEQDCRDRFETCCGAKRWARAMTDARPYKDAASLLAFADMAWQGLARGDWLEAFACHPRIGARAARGWAAEEQAGAAGAEQSTVRALAQSNIEYESRFQHVFIVCATGKSAAQMLELLRSRMGNSPEAELRIAAAEQAKITRIRLEKMLNL